MGDPPEMIARVGDAIRRENRAICGSDLREDIAWNLARAAIDAMRHPTTEMVYVGSETRALSVYSTWRAMIAASLHCRSGDYDKLA